MVSSSWIIIFRCFFSSLHMFWPIDCLRRIMVKVKVKVIEKSCKSNNMKVHLSNAYETMKMKFFVMCKSQRPFIFMRIHTVSYLSNLLHQNLCSSHSIKKLCQKTLINFIRYEAESHNDYKSFEKNTKEKQSEWRAGVCVSIMWYTEKLI